MLETYANLSYTAAKKACQEDLYYYMYIIYEAYKNVLETKIGRV